MNASIKASSLKPAGSPASRPARLGTFVFFALLGLIALVAVPYGSVEPWWQAVFECVVLGLAALWLIEGFLSGSWNVRAYYLFVPLLALAVFAFFQSLPFWGTSDATPTIEGLAWQSISADPHGSRRWVIKLLALILVGVMLQRYTSNQQRLRTLLYLVIGIALASAIFGLLRQMTQTETGFILPNLYPKLGYAQFINKNHFAFLIEMAVGLVLGMIVWGGLTRDRLIASIAIVLLLGGTLVLANSRSGIFALFCQCLFAALLFLSVRPFRDSGKSGNELIRRVRQLSGSLIGRGVLVVCFVTVITIGIVWIGGGPLVENLGAMPTEVGASSDSTRWSVRRWDIWPATWKMIKDHPIAGVGFGGYWIAITAYHDASGEMTPQEAHNDYLEFLASGGLIALALGVWFLYLFIRRLRECLHTSDKFVSAARRGAIIGIAALAIHSLVDFGLHIPINAAVFVVLVVIATADVSEPRPAKIKQEPGADRGAPQPAWGGGRDRVAIGATRILEKPGRYPLPVLISSQPG